MKHLVTIIILAVPGLVWSLCACNQQDKADPIPATDTSPREDNNRRLPMLAFACGADSPYLVIHGATGDPALLLTPDGARTLLPTPTASGAKYADDKYTLWTKGNEVMLVIGGIPADACRVTGRQALLERAWSEDVVFLAMGQEPGWSLRATATEVVLTTAYGQKTRTFDQGLTDLPTGFFPTGTFNLQDQAGEVVVRLTAELCGDTMSGEPYTVTVTVVAGNDLWTGCGLSFR